MTAVQNQSLKVVLCATAALTLNALLAWGAVRSTATVAPVRHWVTLAQYTRQVHLASADFTRTSRTTTAALVE